MIIAPISDGAAVNARDERPWEDSANSRPWRILLLTCRTPETDFRLPLARELHALGHRVTYAHIKKRPVVTEIALASEPQVHSIRAFLLHLHRELRPHRRLLVFNSTNLAYPGLSRLMRQLCGGIWCFDMHDDLLYGRKGIPRAKAAVAQQILLSGSDLIVHAAPALNELFPFSRHLGNASSLTRLEREIDDFSQVLVLASFDERFDFGFMAQTAAVNPHRAFHLHGQVSQGDTAIRTRLDALIRDHPNVLYHGPYVSDDLPIILSQYPVTLAPYKAASRLTHFIDPLRYYHCLNSGMEVISTDIPKARDLAETLHIVQSPADIAPLLLRLQNDTSARKNSGSTASVHNWRNRAIALMQLVEAHDACSHRAGR